MFRDDGEKPGRPSWLDGDMRGRRQSPMEVGRSWGRDMERLVDEDLCVRRSRGRGREWEKKTRQGLSDPSSVLLLTVDAISCSDGKIRSILPFLNCPGAARVSFLFWLWLFRGRSTPRTLSHFHTLARSCGHDTTLTSSDDFAIASRPCLPLSHGFHMAALHIARGASLSLA